MNIFITSWRSFVALELVRLLANNNIFIWESKNHSISFASKYVNKKIIYPAPNKNINEFRNYLLKTINENKIDYLIPTCEEVFYIAKIKDFIESNSNCKVFCGNFDLLTLLHSKYAYIDYIQQFDNIKHPKTLLFNNEIEVKNFINKNSDFKYVLKPEFSRFAWNLGSNMIEWKSLEKFRFESNSKYIIQEYIDWDTICIFAVFSKWNLSIYSFYKNLLTYSGWSWIYFENYWDKILEKFLIDFWKKTSYHWQVSFDIILNKTWYYIIECNPRTTSWIHLFSKNKDFEKIFISSMDAKFSQKVLTPNQKSRSFKLILVFSIILFIFNTKKRKYLYEWLFKTKDIVYDKTDLKTFFYQLYEYICYIFESLKNHESITKSMTNDIEYNWIIK